MEESAGKGYAVSAVNRSLMRNGAFFLVGAAVIVAVLMIILPAHYYFGVHHGSVTLYSAKITGFLPTPVKGYRDIPVGSEAIQEFAKRSFSEVEQAVTALREFLTEQLEKQAATVAEKEQEIARVYESYIPDLAGAQALGIEGLDEQVEALQGWMKYYQAKAAE